MVRGPQFEKRWCKIIHTSLFWFSAASNTVVVDVVGGGGGVGGGGVVIIIIIDDCDDVSVMATRQGSSFLQ